MDNLLTKIEEVKEKLTSREYMDLMAALQKVHVQSNFNIKSTLRDIREQIYQYVEFERETFIEQISVFNTFVYENCKNPCKYVFRVLTKKQNHHEHYLDLRTKIIASLLEHAKMRAKLPELVRRLKECARDCERKKLTDIATLSNLYDQAVMPTVTTSDED